MADTLSETREQLAIANRIIAHEGVLDAFGHVSVRHPTNPNRYLLSRSRSPELVQPDDLVEFDLDSKPVVEPKHRLYGERVIHGEIYKARPDVMAVCHHHSPSILPFCIAGVALQPVFHLGATMGDQAPFWDSRDEFGDTTLIVGKPEEGASLARALGPHWTVLMRRHGATVAGKTLQELVFRTIYTARNAALQLQAHMLGHVSPLTAAEIALAGPYNLQVSPVSRAWEYWSTRLRKAEDAVSPAEPRAHSRTRSGAKPDAKLKAKPRTAKAGKSSRRRGR